MHSATDWHLKGHTPYEIVPMLNIHFMKTWQTTAKACCNDISTLFAGSIDAIRVSCFKDTPKLGDAIRWVSNILSRLRCVNSIYLSGKVNNIIKDCTINTRKAIEEVCKMNYHVFTALDEDYLQVREVYFSQYLFLYRTHPSALNSSASSSPATSGGPGTTAENTVRPGHSVPTEGEGDTGQPTGDSDSMTTSSSASSTADDNSRPPSPTGVSNPTQTQANRPSASRSTGEQMARFFATPLARTLTSATFGPTFSILMTEVSKLFSDDDSPEEPLSSESTIPAQPICDSDIEALKTMAAVKSYWESTYSSLSYDCRSH
jgi:hypothetical protein